MALTTINVNKQFPVGSIIQTVSSTKLDAYSNNATSLTDITGTDQDGNGSIWCAKITPSSASNKILVLAHISFNATDSGAGLVLFRGTSQIYKGAAVGSRNSFSVTGLYGNAVANTATNNTYSGGISHMSYLDDGDSGNGVGVTTELIYKFKAMIRAQHYYLNQTIYDVDNDNASRTPSSLTLMEIKGA